MKINKSVCFNTSIKRFGNLINHGNGMKEILNGLLIDIGVLNTEKSNRKIGRYIRNSAS